MQELILAFVLQRVAPLIISWLQKEGYVNAAEALVARGAVWTVAEVKSLKTYSATTDFPKQHSNFN